MSTNVVSLIWKPKNKNVLYEIERIQKNFLRFINFKINPPLHRFDH